MIEKLDSLQQEAFDLGAEAWLLDDRKTANIYDEEEENDLWYAWEKGWEAQKELGVQDAWRRR